MVALRKTDSSSGLLVALIAFWSTVLLVRIVECWLVAKEIMPAIIIKGHHIHHFVIGFVLISLSLLTPRAKDEVRCLLMGIGLGLTADEFLFWTMLEFDYWSLKNLLATIAIGSVLAGAYQWKRRTDYVGQDQLADLGRGHRHRNPAAPLVSVVIPAYNEEKNLSLSLASLVNQSFTNFELIVVDNGSTDQTPGVAERFGAEVICQGRRGVALARQAGFLAARGTIIATTDADTVVPRDWLSAIVQEFAKDKTLVAVGGLYRLYSGSPLVKALFPRIAYHLWRMDRKITGGWSLPGCNMAVAREAFLAVGGFNTGLRLCEDWDLVQRLRTIGEVILKPDLLVATSGRRYRNGLMSGLLTYAPNLLSSYLLKRPMLNRLPVVRQELPSRPSLMARTAVWILILVYVFSYGNVALARTRKNVLAHSKQAVTKIESMGKRSLAKHFRKGNSIQAF